MARAHLVVPPKVVAIAYFIPFAFLLMVHAKDCILLVQVVADLERILGQFSEYSGGIIALAETGSAPNGRGFFGSPLVASLCAVQKVAFDITSMKQHNAPGDDSTPTRDAFNDMLRHMILPERTALSTGLTQLITSLAAGMLPFTYHRPNQEYIACIEDIFLLVSPSASRSSD